MEDNNTQDDKEDQTQDRNVDIGPKLGLLTEQEHGGQYAYTQGNKLLIKSFNTHYLMIGSWS